MLEGEVEGDLAAEGVADQSRALDPRWSRRAARSST
jgi:hypothetical protein